MRNAQSSGDSLFNSSAALEPINGIQGNQAKSPQSSNQLASAPQSSGINQKQANNTPQITGAALKKALKTLRGLANFVPMAPGLGPALEIVYGWIVVYHVSHISENVPKEQNAKCW